MDPRDLGAIMGGPFRRKMAGFPLVPTALLCLPYLVGEPADELVPVLKPLGIMVLLLVSERADRII